jgi:hypothetical protein
MYFLCEDQSLGTLFKIYSQSWRWDINLCEAYGSCYRNGEDYRFTSRGRAQLHDEMFRTTFCPIHQFMKVFDLITKSAGRIFASPSLSYHRGIKQS